MTQAFELQTDGRTVWVNGANGHCLGRFGPNGVDVHTTAKQQLETGIACAECTHEPPTHQEWVRFVRAMNEHHAIQVPDHMRPGWLANTAPGVAYEYALLGYHHNRSRDERIHVGLVLWVPAERRIFWFVQRHTARLSVVFEDFDQSAYRRASNAVASALGTATRRYQQGGWSPSAAELLASCIKATDVFRWSEPSPGIATSANPEVHFEALREAQIERHERHAACIVSRRRREELS